MYVRKREILCICVVTKINKAKQKKPKDRRQVLAKARLTILYNPESTDTATMYRIYLRHNVGFEM